MTMPKLSVSTKVQAPIEAVRSKRTSPADIMQRNHASDDRCCPASMNDLRVGGLFSSTMAAKDGSFSFDFTGQYDVIEPMSRIEYTMGAFEKHFVPAGRQVTITFEDMDDGVLVTEFFDAEEAHSLEMQTAGRQSILDNFKKHTESCVIVSSRIFDISYAALYQAWTDPSILAKRRGPTGFTNTFTHYDLRVGGEWDFMMHGPDGTNYHNHCVFDTVTPEKITRHRLTEPLFDVVVEFTKISEGQSRALFTMIFPSPEECNQIKAFVLEKNEENFDRLSDVM